MKSKLSRILLVDDSEADNFFHKLVITQAKITASVQVLHDGLQALEYLKNQGTYQLDPPPTFPRAQLILLDINMPRMDGWEFLEEYEKLPAEQRANIVVVMLTTSLNPDDKAKAKQFPSLIGYENKPLKMEALLGIVNQHFETS